MKEPGPRTSPSRWRGSCHCGALGVVFSSRADPGALRLHACQCGFCLRHGAQTIADPAGRALFLAREQERIHRYRFGLGTADFVVCTRCGVYAGALLNDGGRSYATINALLFDDRSALPREAKPVSWDGETAEERRARRVARWTPAHWIERREARSDDPAAAALLDAYYDELRCLLGSFDPGRGVSATPDDLARPGGAFLLLVEEGVAVACGGLKTHAPGVGELKRMFVARNARGLGVGALLLDELEREARLHGMKRLVLDTAAPLAAAAQLYATSGYAEVARFNDNPYAARWFSKAL